MPNLSVADRDQIVGVYRQSRSLWGAGLGLEDYVGLWDDLQATDWGSRHIRFLVWHDDGGRVLSSMKLYRPTVRMNGRTFEAWGIGAVFTPPDERGCGHARAMLRHLIARAERDGGSPLLLFTDIGTEYYETFGFRALPAEESLGTSGRPRDGAPRGVVLRPMEPRDLGAVMAAHDAWCDGRPVAVVRDRSHWEFLLARSAAYFNRFDGSGLGDRFRVAELDGRFLGYVVAVAGDGAWDLREVGALDAAPDRIALVLRAAGAEARAAGLRVVTGWIPPSWCDLVPEWRLRREPRTRGVPMILAPFADPFAARLDADGGFIPYMDQF